MGKEGSQFQFNLTPGSRPVRIPEQVSGEATESAEAEHLPTTARDLANPEMLRQIEGKHLWSKNEGHHIGTIVNVLDRRSEGIIAVLHDGEHVRLFPAEDVRVYDESTRQTTSLEDLRRNDFLIEGTHTLRILSNTSDISTTGHRRITFDGHPARTYDEDDAHLEFRVIRTPDKDILHAT
ncbi:MAG TPA: hypothetical protein VGB97_01020 [Candidatus Paceibacterota bacterium]|jgi:hypothetical protein